MIVKRLTENLFFAVWLGSAQYLDKNKYFQ